MTSGHFKLNLKNSGSIETTRAIRFDATVTDMKSALEELGNVGLVSVSAITSGWKITFLSDSGSDLGVLSPSWDGNGCYGCMAFDASYAVDPLDQVVVLRIARTTQLGGYFSLSYHHDETPLLRYDASAADVENALNALDTTGAVQDTAPGIF